MQDLVNPEDAVEIADLAPVVRRVIRTRRVIARVGLTHLPKFH